MEWVAILLSRETSRHYIVILISINSMTAENHICELGILEYVWLRKAWLFFFFLLGVKFT